MNKAEGIIEEPVQVVDGEYEDSFEKPDFVKKIEAFDVNNLSPEDIDFMISTAQGYLKENFPVNPELVDRISSHVAIMSGDEFNKKLMEIYARNDGGGISLNDEMDTTCGFYDSVEDTIFINSSQHTTAGTLFFTLFHESLHYVSRGNNAGLDGGLHIPAEYLDDIEKYTKLGIGLCCAMEGTTQYFALNSLDDMGFDYHEDMGGYFAATRVMYDIWGGFSDDVAKNCYFQTPVVDICDYIDETFGSDGIQNSVAMDCITLIGATVDEINELRNEQLDNEMIEKRLEEIDQKVQHAIGYFIVSAHRARGVPINEDIAKAFSEYVGPFMNG